MVPQDTTTDDSTEDHAAADGVTVIDRPEDLLREHPLVALFGDTSRVRILVALHTADRPLNPTAIVERADVGTRTWYNHRDDLLATGLVEKVGDAGNSPLYAIVDAEADQRVAWLDQLADWTAAYAREGRRPTVE